MLARMRLDVGRISRFQEREQSGAGSEPVAAGNLLTVRKPVAEPPGEPDGPTLTAAASAASYRGTG